MRAPGLIASCALDGTIAFSALYAGVPALGRSGTSLSLSVSVSLSLFQFLSLSVFLSLSESLSRFLSEPPSLFFCLSVHLVFCWAGLRLCSAGSLTTETILGLSGTYAPLSNLINHVLDLATQLLQ